MYVYMFVCLLGFHNVMSLSLHEQVCLMWVPFARHFSRHRVKIYAELDQNNRTFGPGLEEVVQCN